MLVGKKSKDIANQDSLCFSCSIGQECCRELRFLRLTKSEYRRHFAEHQNKLIIQDCDQTCLVSSKNGQTCPNWISTTCTIYADRPVECRIFPYTLGTVYKVNNRVFISYHERTRCPQKKALLMSHKELEELLIYFAHEAFGNSCEVKIKKEHLMEKLGIKLRRKLRLLKT